MEGLFYILKNFLEVLLKNPEVFYIAVESPKRKFGVYLKSIVENKPHRCKGKSLRFFHLQSYYKYLKIFF
jgi:NADH:ubiquinone oxidoreductase subunit D